MNTLVATPRLADAKPEAPPRTSRKRLLQVLLLGLVAKVLVLVAGLGGLELLRGALSPDRPVAVVKAPAGGSAHPLPHAAD